MKCRAHSHERQDQTELLSVFQASGKGQVQAGSCIALQRWHRPMSQWEGGYTAELVNVLQFACSGRTGEVSP